MKISWAEHPKIADAYAIDLISMIELAAEYGVTRQCIHRILKLEGVEVVIQVVRHCANCHAETVVRRHRVRSTAWNYCGNRCERLHRRSPMWAENTMATKEARELARNFFPIERLHVACRSAPLVFAHHAAHRRWHRTGSGTPLWRGDGG